MKQKFFLIMLLLLAVSSAHAYRVKVDGVYYNINGSEASVTNNPSRYTGEVTIPETVTYNGVDYVVTAIGDYAFNECSDLTKVNIPNTVTSFGDWAFANCSGLTSLTIPDALTSVGHYGIGGCSSLTSLTIPSSLTSIGDEAFGACWGLTSLTVASGNPNYDSRDNCNAIIETASNTLITGTQNTVIPNSVTAIGDNAFSNCRNLKSITIPSSITSIGEHAFFYCYRVTSVTIPSSVTNIGINPFLSCDGLRTVTVESGNPNYDSRDNCNAIIETASNTLVTACKNTVIPNSITAIGDWAFGRISSLRNVTIPDGVTSIGNMAFYFCQGLKSVTIPRSVKSFGNGVFSLCYNLTNVYSYILDLNNVTYDGNMLWDQSIYSNCTLHVPYGTANVYQADLHWGQYFGTIVEMDVPGDINRDGQINIADVNALIDLILYDDVTAQSYPIADVNNDGYINISDLTGLLYLILTVD